MYIVDQTYFTDYIELPNLNEANSKSLAELNRYIGKYVRSILKRSLGYVQWAELDSYIVNGVLSNSAPQKWKDLIDGVEYTVDSVDYVWKGLKDSEGECNMLASFVFYNWLTQNTSFVSGVGEMRSEAKGSEGVNSTQRATEVWNDFVKEYQGEDCVGYGEVLRYDIGTPHSHWYETDFANNTEASLLQFLSQNDTIYEESALEPYAVKNQLGL